MKNFHALSFGLGLVSGCLLLLIVFGGTRLMRGPSTERFGQNGGNRGQFQGGNGGFNLARMAERVGITEQELQAELDKGKTMQQIASEHGVELPGRGPGQSGSGSSVSSSTPSTSSSSSSLQ